MSKDQGSIKPGNKDTQEISGAMELDKKSFEEHLKKWVPDLSDDALSKIHTYYAELVRFNKAVNLISPGTIRTADSVHFADSILASKTIVKALIPNSPLYDVGSGNGFPGIVIAILHPNVQVVLVDRDKRKVEFLKHITSLLGLKNVSTQAISLEEMPPKTAKNMVSRGFAPLHRALLVARKQVAQGGRYFHMKGDGWANELASVPSQLFSFWSPSLLGQYRLPDTSSDMAVIVTEKISD